MSTRQILVVEDERIVAAGIKHELESFGYRVAGIASSATDAVEQAVRAKPNLVLMDIHLDGETDGVEAARQIHDRCGIPVVYLTAHADQQTVTRAGETEAYGYLLKPYEERELQTTIEVALAKHDSEQRLVEVVRWLAGIVGGIDDAVIAIDPDKRVRFINRAGEGLTGTPASDVPGSPLASIGSFASEDESVQLEPLADLSYLERRVVELPAKTRFISQTGHETPVIGKLRPIIDSRGECLGSVLTFRDVDTRLDGSRVQQENGLHNLPCPDARAKSNSHESGKPHGSRPAVMLAETEPMVCDFARLILEGKGYQVHVVKDGVEAIEHFRQSPEQIDLAIIDLNIPRLSADAVLARLLELDPNVEVLFSSGYFAEDHCDGESHLAGVINKPYSGQELVRMVERALSVRTLVGRLKSNDSTSGVPG